MEVASLLAKAAKVHLHNLQDDDAVTKPVVKPEALDGGALAAASTVGSPTGRVLRRKNTSVANTPSTVPPSPALVRQTSDDARQPSTYSLQEELGMERTPTTVGDSPQQTHVDPMSTEQQQPMSLNLSSSLTLTASSSGTFQSTAPHRVLETMTAIMTTRKPYEAAEGFVTFLGRLCLCPSDAVPLGVSAHQPGRVEYIGQDLLTVAEATSYLEWPEEFRGSGATAPHTNSHPRQSSKLDELDALRTLAKEGRMTIAPATGSAGDSNSNPQTRAKGNLISDLVEVMKRARAADHGELVKLLSRLLLTRLVDHSTPLQERLNIAAVAGALFGCDYFAEPAPAKLIELFSGTIGGIATTAMAVSIAICLEASHSAPTAHQLMELRKLLSRTEGWHSKGKQQEHRQAENSALKQPRVLDSTTPQKTTQTTASSSPSEEKSSLAQPPRGIGMENSAQPSSLGGCQSSTTTTDVDRSCGGGTGVEEQPGVTVSPSNSACTNSTQSPGVSAGSNNAVTQPLLGLADRVAMTVSVKEDRISRTVYVSRMDPLLPTATLRQFLLTCGRPLRVRLCGDDCSRSRFGFVEFETKDAAKAMVSKSGTVLGHEALRCGPARKPIQDYDPRDAIIDAKKGVIRACLFGLQVSPTDLEKTSLSRSAALSRSTAGRVSRSGMGDSGSKSGEGASPSTAGAGTGNGSESGTSPQGSGSGAGGSKPDSTARRKGVVHVAIS